MQIEKRFTLPKIGIYLVLLVMLTFTLMPINRLMSLSTAIAGQITSMVACGISSSSGDPSGAMKCSVSSRRVSASSPVR